MLAKKRYARHALQDKAIPILFLSLVLISLPPIATADETPSTSNMIFPLGIEIEIPITLSANSLIPTNGGRPIYIEYLIEPGRVRWELKNPSGSIVYFKEVGIEHGNGGSWIEDISLHVPWFPEQGPWRLELWVFDPLTKLYGKTIVTWYFNVGESSILNNIMAPIYWTSGGLPVVGWGAFSTPIPGIFWLTSPFWIFAIFFILLALYKRSIRLAIALIKESGKRFREAWT